MRAKFPMIIKTSPFKSISEKSLQQFHASYMK